MIKKLLFTLLLGSSLAMSAQQGFKDGVEYFRADQPEEAQIILTNTLNAPGTDKATAYYYLGQIALQKGDKAAAKADFDKGIAANAENGYNYIGLGAIDLANGNASAASEQFKLAKKYAKKNADILTEIARAYFNADPVKYVKDIDKYLVEAKKAQKNHPAPFILEGDRLADTNVGDAAGFYEMAAQFDQNQEHPEAYVKYARTYFKVNPTYAINKLNDLLAKQPNSALAQRELAEKYYDNNQLTMAAEQYEKYIQNPNSFKKDKQRLVGLLFFAKRYPESYDMAGELLAEDPTNFYMQRLQFYNKKALEENEAAEALAQKLLNNPKAEVNAQDYMQYGELLQTMGRDTVATEMYEKAVAIAPEKVSLLKDLSSAYNQAKMYEKSADVMQQFVDKSGADVDPNDVFTLARRYNTLAYIDLERGDTIAAKANAEKALVAVDKVLEATASNPHPLVLNTKSDILRYANGNQVNDAVIAADMATLANLDADPEAKTKRQAIYRAIYSRLGNYYLLNHDIPTSRSYFEKFYEVDPSPELREFIDTKLVVQP